MYSFSATTTDPKNVGPARSSGRQGPGYALIHRRKAEWREHHIGWRKLLDCYEGGDRYANEIYGYDSRGLPVRNLVRHKREYPSPREQNLLSPSYWQFPATNPMLSQFNGIYDLGQFPGALGSDRHALTTNDSYEFRRARTPVIRFMAQAIDLHLSRIYSREVKRSGPPELEEFWKDVDGCGRSIDEYWQETIAPILMSVGFIDLVFDHPAKEPDALVESKADQVAQGLDKCVMSYVLPENMVWWKLDAQENYLECVVQELHDADDGSIQTRYRHWTTEGSTLYDGDGMILEQLAHPYGRVPIRRIFDAKKFRCKNVGMPRYEEIAELQRDHYNRSSELILSDALQAHPVLMGPEDYCQGDAELPVGPDNLLPKKKVSNGATTTYEPFGFLDPPKGAAESIRQNMGDIRDEIDRAACLTKPAGVTGTTGSGVAQSGLSKQLDQSSGNDKLSKISKSLGRGERQACEFALMVLKDAPPDPKVLEAVVVTYPTEFDLFTAADLGAAIESFMANLELAGLAPETELLFFTRYIRLALPGLCDEDYDKCDVEIERVLNEKAKERQEQAELALASVAPDRASDVINTPGERDTEGELTAPTPGQTLPALAQGERYVQPV
jgi:hypothetical protein